MQADTLEQTCWAPCPVCNSRGTTLRPVSHKRRKAYQEALALFQEQGSTGEAPIQPVAFSDVCPHCKGSGLVTSDLYPQKDAQKFPHVAIVGGGIAGVALAVACKHRGIPYTLFERDENFSARTQGYGLTLQQASSAMAGLGINMHGIGITSTRHVVFDTQGKMIGEWGLRKWKREFIEHITRRRNVHIARQTVRSLLLQELGDDHHVKWGHALLDISKNANNHSITFHAGDTVKTIEADLVVGADGIRSKVRSLVIPEETYPLRYLDCMVILGICTYESLRGCKSDVLDGATVFQMVNGHERIYAMPYDANSLMWQISFPLLEDDAKALHAQGAQAMKDEILKRFAWSTPVPEILMATPIAAITGYPVYDRNILDPHDLNAVGDITLIGDAAHPMSPFKGQGANQALLDALMLARTIYTYGNEHTDWHTKGLRTTMLSQFEHSMLKRASVKVQGSAEAVKLLHSDAVLHEGDAPRGRGI